MQKLINSPESFVQETLEGIVAAHPNQVRFGTEVRTIVRADATVAGQVAIVTGGGSGHLPLFLSYVGEGLAHGCAVGTVFSSPSSDQILGAASSYVAAVADRPGVSTAAATSEPSGGSRSRYSRPASWRRASSPSFCRETSSFWPACSRLATRHPYQSGSPASLRPLTFVGERSWPLAPRSRSQ